MTRTKEAPASTELDHLITRRYALRAKLTRPHMADATSCTEVDVAAAQKVVADITNERDRVESSVDLLIAQIEACDFAPVVTCTLCAHDHAEQILARKRALETCLEDRTSELTRLERVVEEANDVLKARLLGFRKKGVEDEIREVERAIDAHSTTQQISEVLERSRRAVRG